MDINDYSKQALRTDYKDYADFHSGDTSPRLDYGVMGLVTESAKILNLIKKTKKNLASLDRAAVLEELGDLLWYLNITADELGFSFDEIMKANLTKIVKIYMGSDKEKSALIRG